MNQQLIQTINQLKSIRNPQQMADLPLKAVEHVGDMKNRHIITCR